MEGTGCFCGCCCCHHAPVPCFCGGNDGLGVLSRRTVCLLRGRCTPQCPITGAITNAARETSSPFWRFRSSPRPTLRSSTGCGACCAAVLVRGDLRFLAPPSAPPGWAAHPLQPSSKEETARPADPAPALLTSAEGPPKGFLLRALGDRPEAAPSGPAFRLRTSGCCTGSDGGASASPNPPPATATSAAAASSAAAGWESSDGTAVFKVPDPSTEGSLRAEGEGGAPMTT